MEDGTGTAEGVEDGRALSRPNCEIEHDLGEFGREHADEGVATWAVAVASGVGSDVLDATAFGDDYTVICADDE